MACSDLYTVDIHMNQRQLIIVAIGVYPLDNNIVEKKDV